MVSRLRVTALACLCVAIAAGCAVGIGAGGGGGGGNPRLGGGADTIPSIVQRPREPGRMTPHYDVSRKRVAAKEEPSTLVAEDGTRCTVTKSRFRKVDVGDWATCAWRADGRGS